MFFEKIFGFLLKVIVFIVLFVAIACFTMIIVSFFPIEAETKKYVAGGIALLIYFVGCALFRF